MSPAPQGNLEVERYIGSCLISQRLSSNNSAKNIIQSNHCSRPYHSKGKTNDTIVENRGRTFVKQHNISQRSVCDLNHVGGHSRYSLPPGGLPMPADCNAYSNAHYGHRSGGSASGGWTGLPLISMTTGNPRRGKKMQQQLSNHAPNPRPVKSHQQCNVNSGNDVENQDVDSTRSPLTRLAIHTQGAPLIQAQGRYNNHNRNRNSYGRDSSLRLYQGGDVVRRVDAAKSDAGNQNKDASTRNSDSLSVASDESSGNSENSLPRIIKPRKRRKKDRKPPVNQSTSNDTISQNPPEVESNHEVSPIVTLKPYMPLCFESFGARATSEQKPQDLPNDNIAVKVKSDKDKSIEDLINRPNSADEFPFGNLLDEEEDARSDLSSCAPATLCQCRYCDPSGVIWDVDQRCYSPFLTPPSPTDNRFHYDSANQSSRYSNQQLIAPSFFPYSFDGDLGSILRRSWSDPTSNLNLDSLQKTNLTSSVETPPPSPQGLQVSSEIVTSPNGHRDIEIKFYSSATPPSSTKSFWGQAEFFGDDSGKDKYFSAVDKDAYDTQLFVAEE